MNGSRLSMLFGRRPPRLALSLAATGLAVLGHAAARAADACTAQSTRGVAPVVELYTSEGCNSCPPADRWLSKLKADPAVVALAFHVDYWDRLGWKDRFASSTFTERQALQQASNGARFSYTPQVVVDGRDRTDWPSVALQSAARAGAGRRDAGARGRPFRRQRAAAGDRAETFAAYWAVTEQGHVSAVKAGENEGVTLHHDFVVRDYQPVAAWSVKSGAADH